MMDLQLTENAKLVKGTINSDLTTLSNIDTEENNVEKLLTTTNEDLLEKKTHYCNDYVKINPADVAILGNNTTLTGAEEDEEEPIFKKKSKRIAIIDSDSDEEILYISPQANVSHNDESTVSNEIVQLNNNGEQSPGIFNKKAKKYMAIPKSDSNLDSSSKMLIPADPVYIITEQGKFIAESEQCHNYNALKNSRLALLCDAESSDDENCNKSAHFDGGDSRKPLINTKPARGSNINKAISKAPTEKKMTPREALDQRKEIQAESQRMLRETRVSLPYHKPKAHSIKDFLKNRPRLTVAHLHKNDNTSPSIAIKMNSQHLQIMTQKLREREKVVKEFYKSDNSESEEDEDENDSQEFPQNLEKTVEETIGDKSTETVCGASTETSQIERNNLQEANIENAHGEKLEISEQMLSNDQNCNFTVVVEKHIAEVENENYSETNGAPSTIVEENSKTQQPVETNVENVKNDCVEKSQNLMEQDCDFREDVLQSVSFPIEKDVENDYLQGLLAKYQNAPEYETLNVNPISNTNRTHLLNLLGTCKPCLSGEPNQEIQLEEGTLKPTGVSRLMERFFQHASTKAPMKDKVELDVINLTQGVVHRETIAISIDPKEESIAVVEKPGVKLQKLRNELAIQIAQRRSELWQQKQQLTNNTNIDDFSDKESHCADDTVLDMVSDEEGETEFTDSESTDMEMEKDEDEFCTKLTAKYEKSSFIDDEAQESDGQNIETSLNNVNEAIVEVNVVDLMERNTPLKMKSHRRIIKGFIEDSDEEGEINNGNDGNSQTNPNIQTKETDLNISDEDNIVTPNKPRSNIIVDTIPSGNYNAISPMQNVDKDAITQVLGTQDLINICSGSFPDLPTTKFCFDACNADEQTETQNFIEKTGRSTKNPTNFNNAIRTLDNDDNLISQLIDEEELEQFKKKFESPVAHISSETNEITLAVQDNRKFLSDSSEADEEDENVDRWYKKKPQKQLKFSDDESEYGDNSNYPEEEINLHDEFSDDGRCDPNKIVDYDSEENEIEVDEKGIPPKKLRATDFFENEAELSESEWESADEDEKGLDHLEIEQGDSEIFDEEKVRNDLEKIHVRQVLDQDKREIRILQELLLEDGELHGTGRQRQFKWKNNDDTRNSGEREDTLIETFLDEEEDEECWRRSRHQREMFLQKKQEKHNEELPSENCDLLEKSQIFKLGHELVYKSLSNVPQKTTVTPEITKPSMLLNTRGSFLARNDRFLNKLAELSKVTDGSAVTNVKKMVFQTITDNGGLEEMLSNNSKRKADQGCGTPLILKKLRLSSTTTPDSIKKKQLFQ